jgi:hypothetical protein
MIKSPFYRFSLTAGPDFVRQLLPGARFASEPPGMFAGGRNLPLITASGVDVDLLRHLAWQLRHSAAFSPIASLSIRRSKWRQPHGRQAANSDWWIKERRDVVGPGARPGRSSKVDQRS